MDKMKSNVKKMDIKIEGMKCAACSTRVEQALNEIEGVTNVAVNLLARKASIEYDGTLLSSRDLVETIEKTGYEVPIIKRIYAIECKGRA